MPSGRAPLLACALVASTAGACSQPGGAKLTLLTVNIANGAGDLYRSSEMRRQQARFVAASDASIVAMQEVDIDVERSFHTDTGDDVLGLACAVAQPAFSPDGVRRCSGPDGSYLFGRAFQGDDTYALVDGLPAGISDGDDTVPPSGTDRTPGAQYGDALGVRGLAVDDAYAVGLPTQPEEGTD